MLFNSIEFLFFPVVVVLYFACLCRYRWVLLLAASYYFYAAWKLEYIFLLIACTLISYIIAISLVTSRNHVQRTTLLVIGLCSNLDILLGLRKAADST